MCMMPNAAVSMVLRPSAVARCRSHPWDKFISTISYFHFLFIDCRSALLSSDSLDVLFMVEVHCSFQLTRWSLFGEGLSSYGHLFFLVVISIRGRFPALVSMPCSGGGVEGWTGYVRRCIVMLLISQLFVMCHGIDWIEREDFSLLFFWELSSSLDVF